MTLSTASVSLPAAPTVARASRLGLMSQLPRQVSSAVLDPSDAAPAAVTSHVRPALVLTERQARALLGSAERQDVGRGGCFAAGPAGVQVWSGPFDGIGGSKGGAVHLGSVDWTYDTPIRHWVMIYRAMVTEAGVRRGETTDSVLARVLGLAGLSAGGERLELPSTPARDPFRASVSF
jgi:hypothetical protein